MPRKNNFRLQPVLNFKTDLADALETEFARLKLAHQYEVSTLLRLQAIANETIDQLGRQQQQGQLNCEAIQRQQRHLQALKTHIVQQGARVKDAEQRLALKRAELVKTIQDKQTLQKLQDRHLAQQHLTNRRREARFVDDIVISRYGRG